MTLPAKPFDKPALRSGLLLVWLVSMPLLALVYLRIAPSPDQRQFDYMAWMALHGQPFYTDSFDMNWPGAMILHELAIRLFGPSAWSWHLLDFLMMEGIAAAAALFLWRCGFRLAPFLALVFYPPLYVTAGSWMAGQRDIVAVGILVVALAAMLAPGGRELRAMFLAGALVAAAVLIRPTYLSVLAGLAILEALPRTWIGWPRRAGLGARLAALLAGFAAVTGALALAAAMTGNLDDFYQASFVFTRYVYFGAPPQSMIGTARTLFVGSWHWLSALGALGLVLWLLRDRRLSYPLMLLLGLAAAITLSYVVQNKGFGYHLGGFLLLLVILTMVAIERTAACAAASAPVLRMAGRTGVVLMVLLAVAGTGSKIVGQLRLSGISRHGLLAFQDIYPKPLREMIALIRNESAPDDRFVLYGTAYQIPYLARRLPAYRFITPAADLMTPKFPLYTAWMGEVTDGLRGYRPKFILLTAKATGGKGLAADVAGKPVLGALLNYMSGGSYKVVMSDAFGTLYERTTK